MKLAATEIRPERLADLDSWPGTRATRRSSPRCPTRPAIVSNPPGTAPKPKSPGFFEGREDVHFMAKYLCRRAAPAAPGRAGSPRCWRRPGNRPPSEAPGDISDRYSFRVPAPADAEDDGRALPPGLCDLSLSDPRPGLPAPNHGGKCRRTSASGTQGGWSPWPRRRWTRPPEASEMTDFATLPECRGEAASPPFCWQRMEEEMARERNPDRLHHRPGGFLRHEHHLSPGAATGSAAP